MIYIIFRNIKLKQKFKKERRRKEVGFCIVLMPSVLNLEKDTQQSIKLALIPNLHYFT